MEHTTKETISHASSILLDKIHSTLSHMDDPTELMTLFIYINRTIRLHSIAHGSNITNLWLKIRTVASEDGVDFILSATSELRGKCCTSSEWDDLVECLANSLSITYTNETGRAIDAAVAATLNDSVTTHTLLKNNVWLVPVILIAFMDSINFGE